MTSGVPRVLVLDPFYEDPRLLHRKILEGICDGKADIHILEFFTRVCVYKAREVGVSVETRDITDEFKLIVVDLHLLPDTSPPLGEVNLDAGVTVMETIRADQRLREIPIVTVCETSADWLKEFLPGYRPKRESGVLGNLEVLSPTFWMNRGLKRRYRALNIVGTFLWCHLRMEPDERKRLREICEPYLKCSCVVATTTP